MNELKVFENLHALGKRVLGSVLLLLLLPGAVFASAGVQGRAAWRGELIEGIVVRAYAEVADIAAGKVLAASAPTGLDGVYRLDLPPGSYVLTATDADARVEAGDLFCYYSGSPVRVQARGYRNIGFNLVRVPAEAPPRDAERAGIDGEISYRGEPLEQAYLYVYDDPAQGFKGPGYFIQPVAEGRFRLTLPPGEYYLLARKRLRGGPFGPIEIGDYFNYYHGNPVRITEGRMLDVQIETITRLSMLEEDPAADLLPGIAGEVVDTGGRPVAGLVVFAYRSAEMTGTPAFFSEPTDAAGRFRLALPPDEPFYLLARQEFGGPAAADELYGRLTAGDGRVEEITVGESGQHEEVRIHVAPKQHN